ncbi:hypothetical protein ACWO4B_002695 [Clostridium sporogenes]
MKKKRLIRILLLCISIIICFGLVGCDKNKPSIFDSEEVRINKKAYQKATEYVKEELKCPSTATFPDYKDVIVSKIDAGFYIIGYVDSENSFGAKIRSKYRCTLKNNEDMELETIYFHDNNNNNN